MLSVLVLFLTFGGVFFVSFTFTYNHSLIPSYLSSSKISKSAVNQHILQLAQKFNLHLIELKVDHEEETETMRSHVDNHVHAGGSASSGSSGTSSVEEIVVKSIFSLGLSLSAMLVVLILCELMDFLNSLARLFCFHLVINLIIALLTMVQPFIILSLSIFQRLAPPRGYLITLLVIFAVSYLSWFILLHKLGSLTLSYLPVTGSDRTIIEKKTNEISIAGITIMAILSGVGSMSTPYRQLPVLYNRYNRQVSRRNVTQLDLNNMIQSYNHTEALVAKRKQQLNSLQLKSGGTVYSGGGSDSPTQSTMRIRRCRPR